MPTPQRSSDPQEPFTSAATHGGANAASAQLAVFSADLQGEFKACNAAFSRLFGYSSQELVGRDFCALFTQAEKVNGEDRSFLRKAILSAMSAPVDYQCRLFAQPKTGPSFPVQFSATMLGTAPAALIAVVTPLAATSADIANATSPAPASPPPGVISRKIDGTVFILASPVMHRFMALVDRVAGHTETVLITGETGTGKELIARTIHESSNRRIRPWVDINCAALPENLVESELFGYEKGALPTPPNKACSKWPTGVRCSWTKSASCNCRRR
jgi:PAS domain S-box-containing protein